MHSPTPDHWFVAFTQPMREKYAAEWVARQGFEFFLPLCEQIMVRHGRKHVVTRPLFPNYLFVRTPHGQWRVLLSTFGIAGVVTTGGDEESRTPAHIRNKVIDAIKARQNRSGIVELPKLQQPFELNTSVAITKGAFAGKTGLYDGQTEQMRQKVLLDFAFGKITVLFGKDELRAA